MTNQPSLPAGSVRFQFWRVLPLVIFILVPLVNYIVPQWYQAGDRFADDAQTRVNAASYAFAIWGVIFSGMLWFSGYLLFSNESWSTNLKQSMICLSIAGMASIAFVPISIYGNQVLGWFDILAHLIPLALANHWLRKHVAAFPKNDAGRWSFFGPSMYFGWISAATVISTALMLNQLGIQVSESLATTASIVIVLVLATIGAFLTLKRDPVYGLTVVWALAAVGIEQSAYPPIRWAAWIAAGCVTATALYQLTRVPKFYAVSTPQPSE